MRVLLADDHRLLTDGVSNLLAAYGIEVVGIANDGLEAIALAQQLLPDLILMDIRMPRCNGLTATRKIKAILPQIQIVMLTTSTEDQDLFDAVKSGACGYLFKSMSGDAFIDAVRGVEQGVPPFSPGLAARLVNEFSKLGQPRQAQPAAPMPLETGAKESAESAELTARQTEVLELVASGLTYKEVGVKLSLSERTVRFHMAEIMNRLHLHNRAQVMAYAGRIGLPPPG